jgi:hypothetical protein
MACDAHGHRLGTLPIQFANWTPMPFLQELATVGMVGKEIDDLVQRALAICVLFDFDHYDRTLGLQQIRGSLKHRQLMTFDIYLEEPDIIEFKVIKWARGN